MGGKGKREDGKRRERRGREKKGRRVTEREGNGRGGWLWCTVETGPPIGYGWPWLRGLNPLTNPALLSTATVSFSLALPTWFQMLTILYFYLQRERRCYCFDVMFDVLQFLAMGVAPYRLVIGLRRVCSWCRLIITSSSNFMTTILDSQNRSRNFLSS